MTIGINGINHSVGMCFIAAGGEGTRIEAGTNRYPFMFQLPPNVPSSFEGERGYIRYTAEATMERPWKFNHVTRSAFTVISLVDLNMVPLHYRVISQVYLLFSPYTLFIYGSFAERKSVHTYEPVLSLSLIHI